MPIYIKESFLCEEVHATSKTIEYWMIELANHSLETNEHLSFSSFERRVTAHALDVFLDSIHLTIRKPSHFPANHTNCRARATNSHHDSSSRTDNAGQCWRSGPAEPGRKRPRTGGIARATRECITCDDRRPIDGREADYWCSPDALCQFRRSETAFRAYGAACLRNGIATAPSSPFLYFTFYSKASTTGWDRSMDRCITIRADRSPRDSPDRSVNSETAMNLTSSRDTRE